MAELKFICLFLMEVDSESKEPSHFDTLDTKFLEVSPEKLTVKYIGRGSHQNDVGVSKSSILSFFLDEARGNSSQ